MSSTIFIGKMILIPITFILAAFGSYLPYIIIKYQNQKRQNQRNIYDIIGIGAALAAGIIIGTAFLHTFPEASEAWNEYLAFDSTTTTADDLHSEGGESHPFPYTGLIAAFVLFALVYIDNAFARLGVSNENSAEGHNGHNHMMAIVDPNHHSHAHQCQSKLQIFDTTIIEMSPVTAVTTDDKLNENHHKLQARNGAFVFFVAITIHSFIDGLSLGAETEISGFYSTIGAVVGHKLLDGFALGIPLYYANMSPIITAIIVLLASGSTPLGIGIGYVIDAAHDNKSGLLARAIILSISLGSFIFISLIELLPAALHNVKHLHIKMAAVFVGWGVMALLALWI
jgi:zinc transporter 1/2/3